MRMEKKAVNKYCNRILSIHVSGYSHTHFLIITEDFILIILKYFFDCLEVKNCLIRLSLLKKNYFNF